MANEYGEQTGEPLATTWRFVIPNNHHMAAFYIYGGECEECDEGQYWLASDDHVFSGVGQCSDCRSVKRWGSIGIRSADWVAWGIAALRGQEGYWKSVNRWPPVLTHHTTP